MDKRHTDTDNKLRAKISKLRRELGEALENELKFDIYNFKRSKVIQHAILITERAQKKNIQSWQKKLNAKIIRNSEVESKQSEVNIMNALIMEKKQEANILAAQVMSPYLDKEERTKIAQELKEVQTEIKRQKQLLGLKRRGLQILKKENTISKEWNTVKEAFTSGSLDEYLRAEINALDDVKATDISVKLAQQYFAEADTGRVKNTSLKENRFELTED